MPKRRELRRPHRTWKKVALSIIETTEKPAETDNDAGRRIL
jgi:hypothetical protein